MAVTWEKLETFTGSRTTSTPDPENEGETIESTSDCRDIHVRFTLGDITHERHVNVCYDSEGAYDENTTDTRIGEVALGVERKISLGLIS
jgi:hypothetical protein